MEVLTGQDYVAQDEASTFNNSLPFPVKNFRRLPTPVLKAADRFRQVRAIHSGFEPDVVVATGLKAVWITAAALRSSGTPIAAIGHGTEFGVTRAWERTLVVRAFSEAAQVICVSEFTRTHMVQCGVRARAYTTIPNGADESVFRVLPREEVLEFKRSLGFATDRIVLTVGNVTDRKGQEVVIRAMPRILERCPNTRYLMAGLPTEQEKLTRIATGLGVQDRIHFLGRVDVTSLVKLMNCCDLFAMTSRKTQTGDFEGYGIAAIEAALCGAAAIVTAESGLAEAVAHNRTGICTPENDPEAVAAAVTSLLLNEIRRLDFAKAAQMRALREQTWTLRVAEYSKVLRSLVQENDRAVGALA